MAENTAGHDVKMERPNFEALVLTAAGKLWDGEAPRDGETQRLVVAACGPATLVEAVRKAVAAAKKKKECHGVRLEFSGCASSW